MPSMPLARLRRNRRAPYAERMPLNFRPSSSSQCVERCRRLTLFTQAVVAIDGSTFKAVNADDQRFTPARIRSRIAQLEKHVGRYLSELDRADWEEPAITEARTARLQEKLANVRAELERIQGLEQRVLAAADQPLSLTDPHARIMIAPDCALARLESDHQRSAPSFPSACAYSRLPLRSRAGPWDLARRSIRYRQWAHKSLAPRLHPQVIIVK